jgi:WD40 repeat protein
MLCVAAERDVRVWEYNSSSRRWVVATVLDGHGDLVHDVSWAPNLGRAYHLVATACKDGMVRIYRLGYHKATATYQPTLVAKLSQHGGAEVWRVSWNVSGTILASTGDDGVSRLWKADFNGTWHPVLVAAATPAPAGANTTGGTNSSSSSSGNANPGSLMQTSASASSGVGGGATGLNRLQSAPNNNMQPPSFGFGQMQQQQFTPQQQQQQQQHAISSSASFSGTAPSYMKTAPAQQQQHHAVDEVKFSDHRSFN